MPYHSFFKAISLAYYFPPGLAVSDTYKLPINQYLWMGTMNRYNLNVYSMP